MLPPQTTILTPNAIYAPQIIFQTGIDNGRLVTSAQVTLTAAVVDENGKYQPTGQSQLIYISDMENLDTDLSALAPDVAQIYMGIINVIAQINSIRKVL